MGAAAMASVWAEHGHMAGNLLLMCQCREIDKPDGRLPYDDSTPATFCNAMAQGRHAHDSTFEPPLRQALLQWHWAPTPWNWNTWPRREVGGAT